MRTLRRDTPSTDSAVARLWAGTSNVSLKGRGRRCGGKSRVLRTQLHANKFARNPTTEDVQAVARFFREPFWRFGAVLTEETQCDLPGEIGTIKRMMLVLQKRIADIVQATLCKEVKVIFESSERVDKLIQEAFQDFEVHRGPKHVPSECYFMPKSAASPALEVADFVMHAVGGQMRRNLKRRGSFGRDFRSVFHEVDRKLTSFVEVQSMTMTSATQRPSADT
jgi:hypothetical protein